MNIYSEITPEILSLTKLAESTSKIDPALYTKYDVKRGLRDINGKGVLAGLTDRHCRFCLYHVMNMVFICFHISDNNTVPLTYLI